MGKSTDVTKDRSIFGNGKLIPDSSPFDIVKLSLSEIYAVFEDVRSI